MCKKALLILFILLVANKSFAEEDKPCKNNLNLNVKVKPDYPPLKTGFLLDAAPASRDGFFYLGLELADTKLLGQDFSFNLGIASSRVLFGLGWDLFYKNTVGPTIWAGYNIEENSPSFGVGVTVLKL